MDSRAHIGRTADNLQGLGGTHLHAADTELVGIGVGSSVGHKAHHHPGRLGRQIVDGLHLKAGHGQPLGQGIGGKRTLGAAHKLP